MLSRQEILDELNSLRNINNEDKIEELISRIRQLNDEELKIELDKRSINSVKDIKEIVVEEPNLF